MPAFVKSFLAILAGFVLAAALTLGTDVLLHLLSPGRFNADGLTDNPPVLALTLTYTLAYVVAACSFTAFLAPAAPRRHALVLGALDLGLALLAAFRFWDTAPTWYHLGLLVLLLPAAYLGGLLGARSRPDSPSGVELED